MSKEHEPQSGEAVRCSALVSPRRTRLTMLAPMMAVAALAAGTSGVSTYMPRWKFESGDPIGRTAKDGEPFTDSRGRKYVRDAKGTVRRVG
jgi:hypothetical protein